MRERVLEHVGQLGKELLLVDELDGFELPQEIVGALTAISASRSSRRRVNSRPITEASWSVFFGRLVQPIDAGHDHVLDRVGDDDLVEPPGQHVAARRSGERRRLLQRLDDLLDEERVALGLAQR